MSSDELNAYYKESVSILNSLIKIPALSKEEDQRALFLYDYFSRQGFSPNRIGNNIILYQNFNSSKKKIVLNSHIDTVKPAVTYTLNPNEPITKDGKLYGLGSNDAGASLVCLFAAFKYLKNTHQAFDLIFVASAEEEISGQNGIVKVIDELGPIDLAIVGEPTGMQMATAEKGLMVIDGLAKGIAGHAAREEGLNAIYVALRDIEKIKNYSWSKVSDLLGKTKATVTLIQAGTQHNVVPDQCKYVVDVRVNELYSLHEIYSVLQSEVESMLTPRSFRLKPSKIDHSHPIVQKGLSLGLNCYGSPTLSDQALMPYISIKIGPGQSSRSHTADEYIELDEIRNGIEMYIKLLDGLVV